MKGEPVDPGARLVSVAQLLGHLEADPDAAKDFARDPTAFIRAHGHSMEALDAGHGADAMGRARKVLDLAELGEDETMATALPKLSKAAEEAFGSDYRVEVEPFAIRFLERPKLSELLGFRWTITGYIRCTWDGWDGCSIGLDW